MRTNQLLRWFRYLYIDEGLLYIGTLVPMGKQRKLIYQAHKGHSGISETLTKLREREYFPEISLQVLGLPN